MEMFTIIYQFEGVTLRDVVDSPSKSHMLDKAREVRQVRNFSKVRVVSLEKAKNLRTILEYKNI